MKHKSSKQKIIKAAAYSKALAGESIPDQIREKWDENKEKFNGVTHYDLERFARTVAYKVAHNLKNGFLMDPSNDPLVYD